MTLLEEIKTKYSAELIASKDHQAIADAVNVGRVKVVSREGGIGTILNVLGPDEGAKLLDQLELVAGASSAVKWGMKLIISATFDFGLPASRAMIDQLVPEPARSLLKAIAEQPDPIGEFDVRCALYAEDGTFLG